MVTPTSSLQTLANDEAITFVASLQKVKVHLSQELQWMSEQVQQKAVQLRGIETLLSEAEALGLVAAENHPLAEDVSAVVAEVVASIVTATVATHESVSELSATENGSTASVTVMEPAAVASAALSAQKSLTQQRDGQGKAASVKTLRGSKALVTAKSTTAKAKQVKPSTSKAGKSVKKVGVQQFLKPQFQDQALAEAVNDILKRATVPLSADEIMAELYDGLPKADYDRAKHSLANTLSVGKSKGTWKSTGRGRYGSNAVVA